MCWYVYREICIRIFIVVLFVKVKGCKLLKLLKDGEKKNVFLFSYIVEYYVEAKIIER